MSGNFAATRARCDAFDGPILLLQDTTEFSFQRANVNAVGVRKSVNSGRDKQGRVRHHTLCGMLMHSSLAVTTQGLPLGLAAVKFWTRRKFKGINALKRKVNPTRVPIEKEESVRWLENFRQLIELLGQPARFGNRRATRGTLSFYLIKLARLGGYLAMAGDSPPGSIVVWRGLSRLTNIEIGAEEGAQLWELPSCGNHADVLTSASSIMCPSGRDGGRG